jgi:hypothetical protein
MFNLFKIKQKAETDIKLKEIAVLITFKLHDANIKTEVRNDKRFDFSKAQIIGIAFTLDAFNKASPEAIADRLTGKILEKKPEKLIFYKLPVNEPYPTFFYSDSDFSLRGCNGTFFGKFGQDGSAVKGVVIDVAFK